MLKRLGRAVDDFIDYWIGHIALAILATIAIALIIIAIKV